MKNLNTIVKYHGCGIGYLDGTRELVLKSCSKPTFNPFWKNPEHTNNRVAKSTRAELKLKPATNRHCIRKYVKKLSLITVKQCKFLITSAILVQAILILTLILIQAITVTIMYYQK